MHNKPDSIIQASSSTLRESLFGSFRAELWEGDEYVITCRAGVIGHTIDKHAAQWLPQWMNSAIEEALNKLKQNENTRAA